MAFFSLMSVRLLSNLARLLASLPLLFSPMLMAQTADDARSARHALESQLAEADSFEDRFDGEVWMLDMGNRIKRWMPDHQQRNEMLRLVHRESKRNKLDPELVLSVIHVESLFNPYAVSYVGAQGLMQIMPFWREEIGHADDSYFHMETNIRYGTFILAWYLKKEKGNVTRALARYNGSLGSNRYPNKVYRALDKYYTNY